MDGLNIDHLQSMSTSGGPFSWLTSGKVDAVLDIKFPRDPGEGPTLNALLGELADTITSAAIDRIPGQRELAKPPLSAPSDEEVEEVEEGKAETPKVVVDIDLRFRDLKAAVPIFTSDLSYVNNALIRPIVAYINAKKTYIPIGCRIVKHATDFDGSWTVYDCGLMDDISAEVYSAFARDVEDQQSRVRRLKKVGFWTLSLAVHALFMGMAGNVV